MLVADFDPGVRSALAAALQQAGFVVRTAVDVPAALEGLSDATDVLVLDWGLGAETADLVVADATRRGLPCGIIIVSGQSGAEPREAVARWRLLAFFGKPVAVGELTAACDLAARVADHRRRAGLAAGGVRRPEDAAAVMSGPRTGLIDRMLDELAAGNEITPRRREAAYHYLEGLTAQAAADAMAITVNTFHNHIKAVCRDLGVESRLELLKRYAELVDARAGTPDAAGPATGDRRTPGSIRGEGGSGPGA